MNPFKKCRTLALVVCWALAARGFVLLPSGALQPPRASTWSGPSRIRLVDPRLFAGFGKAAKAKKAPKFNGKVSMERHMKSFMKLRAGDWSNVADVYVKGENSEKFYFVGKVGSFPRCDFFSTNAALARRDLKEAYKRLFAGLWNRRLAERLARRR